MFFYSKIFGNCEIICLFKDVALSKTEKEPTKYIITINLSINEGIWKEDFLYNNLKEASLVFNSFVEDFYMISFKI